MSVGPTKFISAKNQGVLWTPHSVAEKGGGWYKFTDPSNLTLSSGNITAVRDLFGKNDLSLASQSGAVISYSAGADQMASHWVAAIPSANAYLYSELVSGNPLYAATVVTVVALCRIAATSTRGLFTLRNMRTGGSFLNWASPFADLCLRGTDSFLTSYTNTVNIGYSTNTWFLWSHQFGVNGFVHETFRNDALVATASSNKGSALGTSAGTTMMVGTANVNGEGLNGQLAELVVLVNASNNDRQKCAGYIAHSHQMQYLLPAGHPYRLVPPLVGSFALRNRFPGVYWIPSLTSPVVATRRRLFII